MSEIIEDLKYAHTHEWVKQTGDEVQVGITDFAQAELGDIVYVDLPSVGRFLQKNDPFGTVESVKTVSDLYAPVSGEVIEINEALSAQPELVNTDPYKDGWMIKIRTESNDFGDLITANEYRRTIET